ncbi:Hint domain-containing protein [Lacimonas salitolerans]|uniref:Hint domain-containing protein n=1 Tax=Lacimonas salitolerans TaxID=1323750 RepID=A0ABW4ECN9_9RHOB
MTIESPHLTPPVPIARDDAPRRRAEIAWLRRNGDVDQATLAIPAMQLFEDCFAAFAHGTPIQTPGGPVPVEDILPGDAVLTVEHGALPVLWRGSLTCLPSAQDRCRTLTRVLADGFGMSRPVRDLLLGPAARVLHRARNRPTGGARSEALVPVAAIGDGMAAFAVTPASGVQLYHLVLPVHATMRVGGLAMECFHPGGSLRCNLSTQELAQFLAMFPHIDQPGDFGPLAYPHLPGLDMDASPAA